MSYYFLLRFKMLNRRIAGFGLHPVFGYLLAIPVFAGLSALLFLKIGYAVYLYLLLASALISGSGEPGRNRFLKTCFSIHDYYWVRIAENIVAASPFVIFMLIWQQYLPVLLLLVISILLAFFDVKGSPGFQIPTPFYRRPFEFIVGFRSSFPALALAWFLTGAAIVADNFNLGIFALMFVFLVCFTFYTQSENEFYVWIFSLTPKEFLFYKIKIAIRYSTYLSLPVLAGLAVFYPSELAVTVTFLCLGYVYLVTVVLAKYSAFPEKMNIPQAIPIALSLVFPPLLLAVIPFFYLKSVKQLNEIL